MSAPTWVPYATLVVSLLAAGGASWAAYITGKLNKAEGHRTRQFAEAEAARDRAWSTLQSELSRAEQRNDSQHAWERDKVTEHYIAVIRAVWELHRTFSEVVIPVYRTTPVGDVDDAWSQLEAAHGRMLLETTQATIVARPAMAAALQDLRHLEVSVMAPLPNPAGVSPVLWSRAEAEHQALIRGYYALVIAARRDLGLPLAPEAAQRAGVGPVAARSLTADRSAGQLREVLARCDVFPAQGARADFLIDGTSLSAFQLDVPRLRARLRALLTRDGLTWAACISDELSSESQQEALRAIVDCVEHGLRVGPASRDTPTGGRVYAWMD